MWIWFYGLSTLLGILYRRLWLKQAPLNNEINVNRVAIEHVQIGIAWVDADGTIGLVNPALADSLSIRADKVIGHQWLELFPISERHRIQNAYSEALLAREFSLATYLERADGTHAPVDLRLVPVHDDKSKHLGHHCLILDLTRVEDLEHKLHQLNRSLRGSDSAPASPASAPMTSKTLANRP